MPLPPTDAPMPDAAAATPGDAAAFAPRPLSPARPPLLRDVLRIDSRRLFAGTAEVQIEHHGVTYRLKQTALGKLILTK